MIFDLFMSFKIFSTLTFSFYLIIHFVYCGMKLSVLLLLKKDNTSGCIALIKHVNNILFSVVNCPYSKGCDPYSTNCDWKYGSEIKVNHINMVQNILVCCDRFG